MCLIEKQIGFSLNQLSSKLSEGKLVPGGHFNMQLSLTAFIIELFIFCTCLETYLAGHLPGRPRGVWVLLQNPATSNEHKLQQGTPRKLYTSVIMLMCLPGNLTPSKAFVAQASQHWVDPILHPACILTVAIYTALQTDYNHCCTHWQRSACSHFTTQAIVSGVANKIFCIDS